MKKLFITASTLLMFGLSFLSCDEAETPNPDITADSFTSESLTSLTSALKTAPKSYTVPDNGVITTEKGTKIHIPTNSLVDKNSFAVSYPVEIEIQEVYEVGDMIRNGISTTSNGELLVSGGQFKMSASKDGEELEIGPFSQLVVEVPTQDPDSEMLLFTGGTGDQPDWVEVTQFDSTLLIQNQQDFYSVTFSDLQWINCDYFYRNNSSDKITLRAKCLYDGSSLTNSFVVYAYFPEINSVTPLSNGNEFSSIGNIPTGLSVKLVGIAQSVDGALFYSILSTTTEALASDDALSEVYELNLEKIDQSQLDDVLDNL